VGRDDGSQFRFFSGWTLGGLYAASCLRIPSNDTTSDCTWLKANERFRKPAKHRHLLILFCKAHALGSIGR
jgi:hypothetical protein